MRAVHFPNTGKAGGTTTNDSRFRFSESELAGHWARFNARGPDWPSARSELLAHYRPVLVAIAAKEARRLPPMVDIDDLISAGCLGMISCLESFRAAAQVTFETYCAKRVRGAMVDYLRSLDWHPRLTQRRHRRLEGHRERFRQAHGYDPQREDLIESLAEEGLDTQSAIQIIDDCEIRPMSSLSAPRGTSGGDTIEHHVRDPRLIAPVARLTRDDLKAFISKRLSRAERLILTLYYFEDMTMREIGKVLGKSESRVSQMHALLLERLKSELGDEIGRRLLS